MKLNAIFLRILLSLLVLTGVAGSAPAQTAPAGTNQLSVVESSALVWDLASLSFFRSTYIHVNSAKFQGRINLDFHGQPTAAPGGKVIGAGRTNITLDYYSPYVGSGTTNFPGSYKYSGSVTTSNGTAKGYFSLSVSGNPFMQGKNRSLTGSASTTFFINNSSNLVSGTTKGHVSVSRLGSLTSVTSFGPENLVNPDFGDGHWVLDLNLATSGKLITGSLAQATLSSGRVMTFSVKGVYVAATQASKIVLTGTGNSQGSSLQIGMIGNEIKTLKGKLLGQSVSVTR